MLIKNLFYYSIIVASFWACTDNERPERDGNYTDQASTLYTKVTSSQSGIRFRNMIQEDVRTW